MLNYFYYSVLDEYSVLKKSPVNIIAGDLHGNIFKLIDLAIMAGYINISENNYSRLKNDIPLLKNKIKFEDYLIFNESKNQLIILGDCFVDRNKYDVLKLIFLNKLSLYNNKFILLYGNHDHLAFELIKGKKIKMSYNKEFSKIKYSQSIAPTEIYSMFFNLIRNHYKLSNILNIENKVIFLSHAPVVECNVKKLIGNNYDTIFDIDKKLNILFNENYMNLPDEIDEFIFNRICDKGYPQDLLCFRGDVDLQISGHDTFKSTDKIISLDNLNGKTSRINFQEVILTF